MFIGFMVQVFSGGSSFLFEIVLRKMSDLMNLLARDYVEIMAAVCEKAWEGGTCDTRSGDAEKMLKIVVLSDVTLCSLVDGYEYFGGAWCLCLQNTKIM